MCVTVFAFFTYFTYLADSLLPPLLALGLTLGLAEIHRESGPRDMQLCRETEGLVNLLSPHLSLRIGLVRAESAASLEAAAPPCPPALASLAPPAPLPSLASAVGASFPAALGTAALGAPAAPAWWCSALPATLGAAALGAAALGTATLGTAALGTSLGLDGHLDAKRKPARSGGASGRLPGCTGAALRGPRGRSSALKPRGPTVR